MAFLPARNENQINDLMLVVCTHRRTKMCVWLLFLRQFSTNFYHLPDQAERERITFDIFCPLNDAIGGRGGPKADTLRSLNSISGEKVCHSSHPMNRQEREAHISSSYLKSFSIPFSLFLSPSSQIHQTIKHASSSQRDSLACQPKKMMDNVPLRKIPKYSPQPFSQVGNQNGQNIFQTVY